MADEHDAPEAESADWTIGVGEDVELPELTIPDDQQPAVSGSPEGESTPPEGESSQPDEPEAIGVPDWAVEAALHAVFAYAAKTRGDHWILTEDEAHAIAVPMAAELTEIMAGMGIGFPGDGIGFLTARRLELAAAIATAIVPRYMRDREIARLATYVAPDDGAEMLHPSERGTPPADGAVNGYDPETPVSMAEALAAKQNGASE